VCEDKEQAESPQLQPTKSVDAKRLILVAFHLPIKLSQVGSNDQGEETWEAEWDQDNIAAKTEDSVAKV